MNESQDTTRRAALVTGSSRGIGLAVAEQLAAADFNVALNCSSEAGLPALREQAGRRRFPALRWSRRMRPRRLFYSCSRLL